MTEASLADTCRKLCDVSQKAYLNPYTYLEWPESMEMGQWFTSPELISLYGTAEYESLGEPGRQKLSFFEAVNFFSLNIHGEKPLVEGLAKRLYSKDLSDYASYMHHFLDEENKHMIYFGGFCSRYAGKIYRDRKIQIPREFERGEEDFLFFAKVMIFEEIVDAYNVVMGNDNRLEPTARKINLVHHLEEARHLVFGRLIVAHLFEKFANSWTPETLGAIRTYLSNYIVSTWKEYYNPDVYKDAGLNDPYGLVESSWNSDKCRKHRRKISDKVIDYLLEREMILEEPAL